VAEALALGWNRPESVPVTAGLSVADSWEFEVSRKMSFQQFRAARRLCSPVVLLLLVLSAASANVAAPRALAGAGPTLGIEVDARDLPRRLVHTRIQVPCQPGELRLWFPKWVPGTHGPYGPIQNVGGLYLETPEGKRLDWRRDEVELCRISCQVPAGVHQITVKLDTIWCGKFRRPAGMCTSDFHTPQKTRLLWVYEGLGEYLGEILQVRSGLIDPRQYRASLAATIDSLSHREGRRWRSLEDTAVASQFLRGGSPNWNELRREQDYYFEGMLVWLEADAIIRERSGGKKSLDDFCRKFFGANSSTAKVVPYELPEIVSILRELADFDWETFLARRVMQPQDELCLDVVSRCGYRVKYAAEPDGTGPGTGGWRSRGGSLSALDSLGLSFSDDGRVLDVIPRMVGDQAGLAPGMKVIGINQKTFGRQSLIDALVDSVKKQKIELLLNDGDQFRTVILNYAGGPRYFELVRDGSKPDLLAEILKPLASKAR